MPRTTFVNTSEPAAPGAQEVVLDLPSALHWTRYQRGQIGPWSYVIFPDGRARVLREEEHVTRSATLSCEAGVGCQVSIAGAADFFVEVGAGAPPAPPADTGLETVARYLARWILAGTAPPPPPEPVVIVEPTATPTEQPPQGTATPEEALPDEAPEGPEPVTPPGIAAEDAPVCPDPDPFMPDACEDPVEPLPPRAKARPTILRQIVAPRPEPSMTRPEPEPETPEPEERLVDRLNLNCSVTATASLASLHPDGGDTKPRASLGCSMKLTDRLSFRGTLIGYANPSDQKSWDPDYTYAFSYRVNDKLTLGYSNYSARFSGGGSQVAGLVEGNLRASYKLPPIPLPNDKTIPCTGSIGLPMPHKESLNLSCGYAVTKKLRIGATAYFYLPGEQGTYQPDYSYTASYRFNDDWLLSYNNYSNNRWPWNKGEAPGNGITGGSLSLTYRFKF